MSHQHNNRDLFFCENLVEIRSAPNGTRKIFGYGALFNVRSREMRTAKGVRYVEELDPSVFDECDFTDMDCKFDHKLLLAAAGNYRRGIDARGSWYEVDYDPMDPDHVSVMRKIQRRDVRGSSFEFQRPLPEDQEVYEEAGVMVRRIKRIRKVYDQGPVVNPAYPATTAFARSLDELDDDDLGDTDLRSLEGAHDTDTNPTDAQKQAGNYRKGKVKVHGMTISIENPKGSERSGVAPDGKEWRVVMMAHYGYILGSKGGDGDHVDVFLTDAAESARVVYVVDQIRPDGSFDEHKALIGPASIEEARDVYLSHYEVGWQGLGAISMAPMECFRAWVLNGEPKRRPLAYWTDAEKVYGYFAEVVRNGLGTSRNAGGSGEEEQRNAGGNPVERRGNPEEPGGNPVEEGRNGAEPEKKDTGTDENTEEQKRLARRKADALLIGAMYGRRGAANYSPNKFQS